MCSNHIISSLITIKTIIMRISFGQVIIVILLLTLLFGDISKIINMGVNLIKKLITFKKKSS